MKKLSSMNFNASTKLSAHQLIALKGGDDKRGDRPGGGVQGQIVAPTTTTTTTTTTTSTGTGS
jgi:natural product precursor